MYSLVVKETIEYYNANRSTVYCTMLDATKAFGRVQYCKLFRKLMDRKLRCYSQIFLLSMYTAHRMHVEWNGCHSRWFSVQNGVKQGGVLSPILFCINMDGLLNKLHSSMIGCCIGSQFTGALAYGIYHITVILLFLRYCLSVHHYLTCSASVLLISLIAVFCLTM